MRVYTSLVAPSVCLDSSRRIWSDKLSVASKVISHGASQRTTPEFAIHLFYSRDHATDQVFYLSGLRVLNDWQ